MADLLLVANPKKRRHKAKRRNPRRRHSAHRTHRRRRSNPHHYRRRRHHMRRRRSNPTVRQRFSSAASSAKARLVPVIKQSFVGAGGALANDALYNFLAPYLSGFLGATGAAGGLVQYVIKLGTAISVGWAVRFIKLPSRDIAVGAATVATHDFLRAQLMTILPSIFGSGAPVALSGYSGLGAYLSGSAPVVGTATFPVTNLPQNQPVQMGAYLSGSSGSVDGSGVYVDDSMGCSPWDGTY